MTDAPTLPEESPRRRRRWIVALIAIVSLILVGVGSTVGVAATYQPVVRGNLWGGPGEGVARLPDVAQPGVRERMSRFQYADGRDVFYGFSLQNKGSWPVMVEEIELEEPSTAPHFMFLPVAAKYHNCCVWDEPRMKDFRPFRLEPGKSEEITIRAVMGNCEYYSPGSSSWKENHRVRVSFMGFDHWVEIPVIPFAVEIPYDYKCPRPKPS